MCACARGRGGCAVFAGGVRCDTLCAAQYAEGRGGRIKCAGAVGCDVLYIVDVGGHALFEGCAACAMGAGSDALCCSVIGRALCAGDSGQRAIRA